MEGDQIEFPASSYFTGYVRQVSVHGDIMWALMDSDGEPVCISSERSVPFFYAANHEITVVLRH